MSNETSERDGGDMFMGVGTQCRECGVFMLATPAEAGDALCQECAAKARQQQGDGRGIQVGDRVRWYSEPWDRNGTVRKLTSLGLVTVLQDGDDVGIMINPRNLTLISRATPAPAVRASGAVDTHTLELPVRVTCCRCDGDGVLLLDDEGFTEQCGLCHGVGWTTDTILLSDNAVDRLAAALAPLLVKRMVHDIRMIANDRP